MHAEFVGPLCWFVFLVVAPAAVMGVFALVERWRSRTRDDGHFRQLRQAANRCARVRSAEHNGQHVDGRLHRLGQPPLQRVGTVEDAEVSERPPGEIRPSSGIPHGL